MDCANAALGLLSPGCHSFIALPYGTVRTGTVLRHTAKGAWSDDIANFEVAVDWESLPPFMKSYMGGNAKARDHGLRGMGRRPECGTWYGHRMLPFCSVGGLDVITIMRVRGFSGLSRRRRKPHDCFLDATRDWRTSCRYGRDWENR